MPKQKLLMVLLFLRPADPDTCDLLQWPPNLGGHCFLFRNRRQQMPSRQVSPFGMLQIGSYWLQTKLNRYLLG